MQGWVRTSRVLALAEHDNNHALFVFMSSRMPPQLFSDLAIERVLPIDADFRCEIGEYAISCCSCLCVMQCNRPVKIF
jgi:phosphatidylinositol-bisphosphatase